VAAWDIFIFAVYMIGILAALASLFTLITGILVICYGIRHFDEWEEKW